MSENLAGALAKFQGEGFPVPRTRTVRVKTKTGEYTFDYAPHELIVAAVRKPLADNGLAVSQALGSTSDGRPALRTILLHASGERLEDTFPLPLREGMTAQEIGSAITYIRRYALSAILGLATEDDDDGNRASGNDVTDRRDKSEDGQARPNTPVQVGTQHATSDGGLIGTAIAQGTQDFELRESPDGWTLPFRVKDGTHSFIVLAEDDLAQALYTIKPTVIDQRVTVWGHWTDEVIPKRGNKPEVRYRVLHLERIQTPDGTLPAEPPVEAETAPLFDDAETAAIDAALDKVPAA